MAELFTDEARFAMWLEVELLATEGWAEVGDVPRRGGRGLPGPGARRSTPPSSRRWPSASGSPTTTWPPSSTSSRTAIGQPEGSWIHYGLTSSDVVDTALCATLTRAADLLIAAAPTLVEALKARASSPSTLPVTGRTHGMHAEPTTFGAKFALWALQADRDRQRLRAARRRDRGGQAVGCRRHLLEHRPEGRGARLPRPSGSRPVAGDPGRRPRPPRRVPVGVRVGRAPPSS